MKLGVQGLGAACNGNLHASEGWLISADGLTAFNPANPAQNCDVYANTNTTGTPTFKPQWIDGVDNWLIVAGGLAAAGLLYMEIR